MNRANFVMVLVLLASLFNVSFAFATADGPDCWAVRGVAKNDVLNIRATPSASAKILGKIPPDAKSIINANDIECPDVPTASMPKECGSGWCKVTYKAVTGWVNCKFLEESTDCK